MRDVIYERQITEIRERHRGDRDATLIIEHFECLVEYAECCRSEAPSDDEQILAAARFVVERLIADMKHQVLKSDLLWVLGCRYPYSRFKPFVRDLEEALKKR